MSVLTFTDREAMDRPKGNQMSRPITLGAIAMIVAGIAPLPLTTANAQGLDTHEAITVTAPHKRTVGRSAIGAPVEIMEAQSIVYYGDLNLATRSGQDELNQRVAAAAESSCKWIDEVFAPNPATSTSSADCKRDAIHRAQGQVNDAIALGG
jgi:UrcA family protein